MHGRAIVVSACGRGCVQADIIQVPVADIYKGFGNFLLNPLDLHPAKIGKRGTQVLQEFSSGHAVHHPVIPTQAQRLD